MAVKVSVYESARIGGCTPLYADGMLGWAWHCTCEDNRHGCDQQCSVITEESAKRAR